MVQLLKFKEQIFHFVGRFEFFVLAAIRFIVAFSAFTLINQTVGYMKLLCDPSYHIPLILALICAFLPGGMMLFFSAVMILLHFFALSKELCAIAAMIFIVLFCLYFRFSHKKGLYAVLTPVLGFLGIPYVMPVSCGLLSQPYTAISVVSGEIVYFLLKNVNESSALFSGEIAASGKSIITLATKELLQDQEMYFYLGAFAAAAIVVYCVRKLSVDHSHMLAIVLGIVIQMAMICAGEIVMGNMDKLTPIIAGCIVSLFICFFLDFMSRSLDYSRVEHLQFEDDEYYYYVKAVPKSSVQMTDKQVKQINAKRTKKQKVNKTKKVMAVHLKGHPERTEDTNEE